MAQFVFLFYFFIISLTAILAIAFVVYAFRIREGDGIKVFGIWMFLTVGWCLTHLALFMADTAESALIALRWEWVFQVLVPPAFLLFIMQYKGYRRWIHGWRRFLLFLFPAGFIASSFNNRMVGYIWDSLQINLDNNIVPIQFRLGSAYWMYWLFAYSCLLLALWGVARNLKQKSRAYLRQARTLMIGISIPLILNIVAMLRPQSAFGFNAPQFSFTLGGVLVGLAIYRYRLFDLSPFYYQRLLESLRDGLLVIDEEGRLLQANQLALDLLGLERSTSIGENFLTLLAQDSPWTPLASISPDQNLELQVTTNDQVLIYSLSCSLIDDRNHENDRVVTMRDVTEEQASKIAEQVSRTTAEDRAVQLDALRKVAEFLNQSVDVASVKLSGLERIATIVGARFAYLILADIHGQPRFEGGYHLPPLLQERFDRTPYCPPCHSFSRFMKGEYLEPVAFIPCEILREISITYSGLISIPLHLGERQLGILNLVMAPNVVFSGDEIRLLQTVGDTFSAALERARLYENAEQLATVDSLTGLFNRRHFFQLAQKEFDRANRYQHVLSILMIDIDYFKQVNDRFGHLTGDQVLQQISDRFQACLRSSDFIGRYGGEEFVILLPETDTESGLMIADRMRASITDRPFITDKGEISLTISIGVADKALDKETSLEIVLENADQALLAAKNYGRNAVSVWKNP
ncbi:MAG: hypothetical protein BGO78_08635 [Chloroflexi bacterium 44-23]|nr:MAG: hypothetical protein BGO78_08635 [Chloroflexi bacterium 44-23]